MQNTEIEAREFKDRAYEAFAGVTKALSSPRRLELLDLLVQGPRSVDGLARGTGQPLATASQHLQVLKRAQVVQTERHGTTVEYRLAPGVAEVFVGLRRLAEARSAELARAKERYYAARDAPEVIDAGELQVRRSRGEVLLLDVRPAEEYAHGHLPGAVNIPIAELPGRLWAVPEAELVVAHCRGPLCTYAAEAVRLLRGSGRAAVRFEGSVADWVVDGGLLERGP